MYNQKPHIIYHESSIDGFCMVTIKVNGEEMDVPPGLTVSGLLQHLEIHERLVVVERNQEILRQPEYASTAIHEGDSLELVHFVGGG